MSKQTQNLINKYNRSVDSIRSQELAIDKVKNKLDALKSGDVIPPSLRELSTQLKQSERELTRVNARLDKLGSKKITTLKEDEEIAKLEQAKVDLQQIISEVQYEIGNAFGKSVEVQQLEQQLDLLNSKLQQTKTEANQTGKQVQEALKQESTASLNGNIEDIKQKFDDVGNKASSFRKKIMDLLGPKGIGRQFNNLSGKVEKFGRRLTRLIGAVAIFNLLRSGLTSLRNGFISILNTNDEFSNSLGQIKGNLMTAFAPIYNAILPAINSLMNALVEVTGTIATFISGLFNISTSKAVKQAKKLSNALGDVEESSKNSLASFDKLEVLSTQDEGSKKSGSDFDYSETETVNTKLLKTLNRIKSLIKSKQWGTLFEDLSDSAETAIFKVTGFIEGINWSSIGTNITTAIASVKWGDLGVGIMNAIWAALSGLGEMILSIDWGTVGQTISDTLHTWLTNIIEMFKETDWAQLGKDIGNAIMDFILSVNWGQLGVDIIQLLLSGLVSKALLIINFFSTIVSRIFEVFENSNIGKFFKDIFTKAYTNIKNVFSGIGNFFSGIWSTIKSIFGNIGTKIGDAFKSAFTTVINAVLKAAEGAINAPIKSINAALKQINKLPGVEISKIQTVSLPRLAEGAVIPPRQEFAAILGDQKHGTNIEAPLDTIKQANREVLKEVLPNLASLTDGKEIVINSLTIVNQLGEQEISRTVVKGVRLAEQEYGKPLFLSS